jgi:hypothetical protein
VCICVYRGSHERKLIHAYMYLEVKSNKFPCFSLLKEKEIYVGVYTCAHSVWVHELYRAKIHKLHMAYL